MKRKSLTIQLGLMIVVITTTLLSGFGYYQFMSVNHELMQQLNEKIDRITNRLSTNLSLPLYNIDYKVVINMIKTEMEDQELVRIFLNEILNDKPLFVYTRLKNGTIIQSGKDPIDGDCLSRKTGVFYNQNKLGDIHVFMTTRHVRENLQKNLISDVLKIVILDILLICFVLIMLRVNFIRPILKLTKVSATIASGNLDQDIDTMANDEIGILAVSLTHMRDSIKEKIAALEKEITERKQAEEELLHLRNYLTNILNSMPSILMGVDPNGKVTQWNNHAEQETGINADAALGRKLEDVFPRLANEMEKVRTAIHSQQPQQDTKLLSQINDETRYEDVTIYPLITSSEEGAVIRIDDVTEQVRMEEMLIHSEKMLSIGGLAAGMAHEINNPLAGIMQTAEVMALRLSKIDLPANLKAAEAAGTTTEAIRNFMEARDIPRMISNINESGSRVAAIVNNMLSFARKSEAQTSLHVISELIDKTLELAATDYDLKKQYDFKMIKIKKEYENNLPSVPCDGAKIQQVLLNILSNGAQAMLEAGTDKPMYILRTQLEKHRKMVCIEVEDNGPGIEEETRKRVFEPFFTTKPVGVGTGLGLSVSYFIITENHSGEMVVESQPGSGAKFIIRLPLGESMA